MFSFDSIEVSSSVVAVVAIDADGNAAADGKFAIMFVVEAAPYLASVFWGEDEGRTEGGAADCSILSTTVLAGLADNVGPDVDAGGTISIVDGAVVSAVAEIVLESVGATGGGGAIDGGGGGGGGGREALAGREKIGAGAPPAKADDARKSISISISIWGAGGGGNAIGGKGRP